MKGRRSLLTAVLLVTAFAIGCTSATDAATTRALGELTPTTTEPDATPATTTTDPPASVACKRDGPLAPTKSFAPTGPLPAPGAMPAGSTMQAIQARNKLFVGVDESTPYFSYRNPESGPFSDPDHPAGEFVGFEPELARRLGEAIFGEGGADKVEFVPLVTDRKVDAVVDGVAGGGVDMTISVVSATCDRWEKVDFTTTYYVTTQGILVRTGSVIEDGDDLAGRRVCVTRGSSSEDYLAESQPDAQVVPVATRAECLVALQEDDVDAIVLPKSILAGLAAQDPTVVIRPVGLRDQYYGIPIAKNNEDLVRFVNGLLEQWRTDDTLADLQRQWLDNDALTKDVPPGEYRDR